MAVIFGAVASISRGGGKFFGAVASLSRGGGKFQGGDKFSERWQVTGQCFERRGGFSKQLLVSLLLILLLILDL